MAISRTWATRSARGVRYYLNPDDLGALLEKRSSQVWSHSPSAIFLARRYIALFCHRFDNLIKEIKWSRVKK